MKQLALLIPALVTLLAGCDRQANDRQAKVDREQLDALLASHIDRIELVTARNETNVLTGLEAERFLLSLNKTNRIDTPDLTKDQVEFWGYIESGTRRYPLSRLDNGLWQFGDYSFCLRR